MPALLKGFIDRVFLPGFAFKYREGSRFWDRLLSGRSAHLLVTMDTPPWYFRWVYRMPGHNQMKRTILEFSGIKPVTVSSFGPIKDSQLQKREKWLAQANAYGRHA
jgi:putative NADPH-quinone reductase